MLDKFIHVQGAEFRPSLTRSITGTVTVGK